MACRHYKYYSVYKRGTDEPVIIHANAKECQERLGITEPTFRVFAIEEHEFRCGRPPAKIFIEADAFNYLNASPAVQISPYGDMRFRGIPLQLISSCGFEIHLSSGPVEIRDFHDPGVQLVLPKEVHK